MKEIDWSSAPEGATHYNDYCDRQWLKEFPPSFFNGVKWVKYSSAGIGENHIAGAVPRPQWRGHEDGLPPAGTVCRIETHHEIFNNAKITYQGAGLCCFVIEHSDKEISCYTDNVTFYPVKSERDKAIEDMLALDPSNGFTSRADFCGILYDACYRKESKQ